MQENIAETIIEKIIDLPTLPKVCAALMEMMENPDTNARDINRLLARDPALASKILKMVNSAYYALPKRIADLNQSIVLLGFKTIKNLILTAVVFKVFKRKTQNNFFDRNKFWKHSIASACLNKIIARKFPSLDSELAYTFGLFHDIGKLIIDEFVPENMVKILENARAKGLSFYESEMELFDINHSQLGYELTKKWQLPDELAYAILLHHDKEEIKKSTLLAINSFSDYICLIKGLIASGSCQTSRLNKNLWMQLDLSSKDLPKLFKTVELELKVIEELLQIAY